MMFALVEEERQKEVIFLTFFIQISCCKTENKIETFEVLGPDLREGDGCAMISRVE